MNWIKNIVIFVAIISGFTSCVEFFRPDLEGSDTKKYVIDGLITNQEGYKEISVSLTSSLDNPTINTMSFCDVKIIDDSGHEFKLTSFEKGKYRVWMGKDDLKPGVSFQVKVLTPSGVEILSDFDQMPEECPEIDSIYYKRKDIPTTDPYKTIQAIQFYLDFNRKSTSSLYYRWEIDETWEHHAVYPITWYLAHDPKNPDIVYWAYAFPTDYSRFTCWTTQRIKDIFTLTTENTALGKYVGNPIQLIDNQTQKLTYCYSALIYQFATSESAFKYYDKLRVNSNQQGGLYNTQPLRIKGNLKCISNPELEVLGFFSTATVKSKRITIQKLENFETLEPSCVPPHLAPPSSPEPHKYEIEINGIRYILIDACVECDYMSGSTVKPNYWPY